MFAARTWTDPVKLFICPSRRLAVALPAQDDAHASYSGGGWKWGKTDYAADALVVPNRGLPLWSIAGVANGPRTPSSPARRRWTPSTPSPAPGTGTSRSTSAARSARRTGRRSGPRPAGDYAQAHDNWGSAHPAGVNFLFCDGSVHLIAYGTSARPSRP